MIKKLLERIKSLFKSDLALESKCTLVNQVRHSVEEDLTRLARQDPTFLDGPNGYVDYYSPFAEAQLNNKKELLEQYYDKLSLVRATLFCLQQKKIQIDTLEEKKENSPESEYKEQVNVLKEEIASLLSANEAQLLEQEAIQNALMKLDQIDEDRNELKDLVNKLKKKGLTQEYQEYLECKQTLVQLKIDNFDAEMSRLFRDENNTLKHFTEVSQEIGLIQNVLTKQKRLNTKIPKGMLDLKRALRFKIELETLQKQIHDKTEQVASLSDDSKKKRMQDQLNQLWVNEQRLAAKVFSTSAACDTKIKERLDDLNRLMTGGVKGYQELAVSGGDLNAFLHQTTAFYWEQLFLYRKMMVSVHEYMEQAQELTEEGKLIAACISKALSYIPVDEVINTRSSSFFTLTNRSCSSSVS